MPWPTSGPVFRSMLSLQSLYTTQAYSNSPPLEEPAVGVQLFQLLKASPWTIPLRRDLLSQANGMLWHPRPELWALHVWPLNRSLSTSQSPSTRHLYALKWSVFSAWCQDRDLDPVSFTSDVSEKQMKQWNRSERHILSCPNSPPSQTALESNIRGCGLSIHSPVIRAVPGPSHFYKHYSFDILPM